MCPFSNTFTLWLLSSSTTFSALYFSSDEKFILCFALHFSQIAGFHELYEFLVGFHHSDNIPVSLLFVRLALSKSAKCKHPNASSQCIIDFPVVKDSTSYTKEYTKLFNSSRMSVSGYRFWVIQYWINFNFLTTCIGVP